VANSAVGAFELNRYLLISACSFEGPFTVAVTFSTDSQSAGSEYAVTEGL
jgi:hypothetical protein